MPTKDTLPGLVAGDENQKGGVRFYGVVTLGNLIVVAGTLVPIMVWGIKLEGRVDQERELRTRLEVQIAQQRADSSLRNDRIEGFMARVNDDVTAIRIRLGVERKP